RSPARLPDQPREVAATDHDVDPALHAVVEGARPIWRSGPSRQARKEAANRRAEDGRAVTGLGEVDLSSPAPSEQTALDRIVAGGGARSAPRTGGPRA